MTYSIQKLDENFPVYVIKKFKEIDAETKSILISLILQCKERNQPKNIKGSFLVDLDYDRFLKNLYCDFLKASSQLFGSYKKKNDDCHIWSYSSNKYDYVSIPGKIHNHKGTSTINSVYYLNIPKTVDEQHGSLSLFLDEKELIFTPENEDLIIFPNYLDHRINNYDTDEEWRISINMEILCEETSDELFGRIN